MIEEPSTEIEQFMETCLEAAYAGGGILKKYWGKLIDIQSKSTSWDLVTEADREADRVILDVIHSKYPDHAILSEETGWKQQDQSEFVWVVDPLDGTTNYTHQYPMVAVSIGLLFQGIPIVGVVYNPIHEEIFHAGKGHGMTLNGKKAGVSKTDTIEKSLVETGFPYDRTDVANNNYVEFCHLKKISQGVRRGGSAALALAYVAAGRLDGFWEYGLQPWDKAAGALLVEEAGGKTSSYDLQVLDLYGKTILATNGNIHRILSEELIKARQQQGES